MIFVTFFTFSINTNPTKIFTYVGIELLCTQCFSYCSDHYSTELDTLFQKKEVVEKIKLVPTRMLYGFKVLIAGMLRNTVSKDVRNSAEFEHMLSPTPIVL